MSATGQELKTCNNFKCSGVWSKKYKCEATRPCKCIKSLPNIRNCKTCGQPFNVFDCGCTQSMQDEIRDAALLVKYTKTVVHDWGNGLTSTRKQLDLDAWLMLAGAQQK